MQRWCTKRILRQASEVNGDMDDGGLAARGRHIHRLLQIFTRSPPCCISAHGLPYNPTPNERSPPQHWLFACRGTQAPRPHLPVLPPAPTRSSRFTADPCTHLPYCHLHPPVLREQARRPQRQRHQLPHGPQVLPNAAQVREVHTAGRVACSHACRGARGVIRGYLTYV